MRWLLKVCSWTLYLLFSVSITIFVGCESVMPTRVPPLSEELGYDIPDYKGWTTTGLNEGYYNIELQKLKILRTMVDVVNVPALQARDQAIDWINVGLSAGVFGGLPLAFLKVPKGSVSKKTHDKAVKQAKAETPDYT